ncbi:MAG: double-strand break repair helicase AddA [Novosphingobium sp.]|nr:double-strand break repair helicase AddA [Novosphingobium sp.]
MSEDEKPLVFPLFGDQRAAVEPADTVWLGASAGTGKTQVLSARVLRLLLQERVRPEQILCLTFTKAGAAEMATRVNEVLASWVRLPNDKLAAQLEHIGADIGPECRERARSRFAAVLDCPGGGLRIGTIHSFAQWLLAAFPLEAGMLPGTRAMEDRDKDLLVRQVLAEILVEAEETGDTALLDALAGLSLRLTSDQVQGWLLRCATAREVWHGTGAWQPPLRPRIGRVLGLGDDPNAALLDLCGEGGFDCAALRQCVAAQAAWGTKTGLGTADIVVGWLVAAPEVRLERLDELNKALFTAEGNPRSLTAMLKQDPDYEHAIERVRSSIGRAMELRGLIALADYMEPALLLGRRFALAWEEAKQREGFIDFDDQIRHAAALLARSEMAEWVRFKLDRQFDHILVDEAQDTNQAQWQIIDALIGDFFSGEGQRGEALRTLFVVGDYKQAIFRFQGTSPENFEAARRRVREQMLGVERELQDLGLDRSFRTARPVLEFVDRAIREIGPRRFGLEHAPDPHVGEDRPGLVTLWPVIGGESEDDGERAHEGDEGWLSRPDRQLAERIARQVRQWLEEGFPLVKGPARMADAGDVMVLVRKRKELAGLIVARLHAAGVPVAGVDRLRLGAPLGVKDLVAALRFAAQPRDDLNLANLLVSPLIGWSQEQLLQYGYREKGVGLWAHLRRTARPETLAAREQLLALLARADFETPQALLHWLLVGPWQGRRKLVARLGREVEDPVNELLNAAFAYASGETASLVGFLQWFDANTSELKREAGRSDGLVRVMTVHGAKGLQAPIVILADAADDPDASPPRGLTLPEPVPGSDPRQVPLPPLRKAEKVGPVAKAEDRAALEERAEHWRLLYVAMTRAEEALFIAGTLGGRSKELALDSWYARLAPLFNDAEPLDDPLWGRRHEVGARALAVTRIVLPPDEPQIAPDWAQRPVGPEPRPPRPLAPSASGEESAADPPSVPSPELRAAAERGVLIHRLLERLPELPDAERASAAARWLERTASGLDGAERDEIAQAALTVLADPQWSSVFGPDSLPEVPIAATVGERVVAGTIDRLVLGADAIRIVDFKTARRPPADLSQVPLGYIRQMAAYAAALRAIHPAQRIEAALLYTHAPRLIAIPAALIEAHKPGSPQQQESFAD